MKLSLFTITTVLVSFVSANPILARIPAPGPTPCDSKDSFKLRAISKNGNFNYPLLQVQPIVNGGYSRFGWFAQGGEDSVLYFPQGACDPGEVLDARRNGFRMQTQGISEDDLGVHYRLILIDNQMHGLTGLYSNQYYACSNKFSCDSEGTWWACHKKVVPGQDDSLDADLYHGVTPPPTCGMANEISLEQVMYPSLVDGLTGN